MKKVLIIGASILQLPAIKRAKELGYYVGVVDFNPEAIGIQYSDKYYNVSTIDVEGVIRVARDFKPNGIMTLATDMPMRAVAAACECMNLPGISRDTALKATDKGEMIKAFEAYGVEHPWYYIISSQTKLLDIINKLSFPCILKPTDNSGSRGVVLCYNKTELTEQYNYALKESRCGSVIVEEYLVGQEFSVEVMVIDGKPHVLQITDKLTTGSPHFVEMGHSQPTRQPAGVCRLLEDLACRASIAIGITSGPAHAEMILTESGPKMVEIGARMGGDCITTHLVPLSTGIDMVGITIKLACGEKVDITRKHQKSAAIRYFNTKAGVLKAIYGVEDAKQIEGIKEISFVKHIGEEVGALGNSADRIGFVISQSENVDQAIRICDEAIKKITIEVK